MIDLLVESIYVLIFQACLSDNKSPWEVNDIYLSPESYKEHSQMLKLIFEKVLSEQAWQDLIDLYHQSTMIY